MAYTVLHFLKDVLENEKTPMIYQDIWDKYKDSEYAKKLALIGKTPNQTIGARLFVDVRDNPDSLFMKVGKNPARFILKGNFSQDIMDLKKIENDEIKREENESKKIKYKERDLHPYLTCYHYAFHNIITKTIYHEKSKKRGLNEWIHPDMVGFYLPIDDWTDEIIQLNRISENNMLKFYSFELKIAINKDNYRESFFQAVSNSSWANEGYLVCANLKEDNYLMEELERLSSSFGIGILKLDIENVYGSKVIFPATFRKNLDWKTMNKLAEQNPDFASFVKDVQNSCSSNTIYKQVYDKIFTSEDLPRLL